MTERNTYPRQYPGDQHRQGKAYRGNRTKYKKRIEQRTHQATVGKHYFPVAKTPLGGPYEDGPGCIEANEEKREDGIDEEKTKAQHQYGHYKCRTADSRNAEGRSSGPTYGCSGTR